jgi:hypothetical protein
MSNEIVDLIEALRDGSLSLDQVANRFRERSWPRRGIGKSTSYLDLATRAQQDPEPYIEGSFDDVAAAYHRGDISDNEYEALAQAMAESMHKEND